VPVRRSIRSKLVLWLLPLEAVAVLLALEGILAARNLRQQVLETGYAERRAAAAERLAEKVDAELAAVLRGATPATAMESLARWLDSLVDPGHPDPGERRVLEGRLDRALALAAEMRAESRAARLRTDARLQFLVHDSILDVLDGIATDAMTRVDDGLRNVSAALGQLGVLVPASAHRQVMTVRLDALQVLQAYRVERFIQEEERIAAEGADVAGDVAARRAHQGIADGIAAWRVYVTEQGGAAARDELPLLDRLGDAYRDHAPTETLLATGDSAVSGEDDEIGAAMTAFRDLARRGDLFLGLLAALSLGIGVMTIVMLERQVVRPVLAVTGAATRLAAGDWETRAPVAGRDELTTLARTFNDMAVTLGERTSQIETARIAAEAANRTKSAFLANMSHEIRTPMNAVLGMVEIVLDSDLTVDQRHSLETVRSAAETLLALLNDILDFSKMQAEHLDLESIPFDLHRLLHETVRMLAIRADSKGIELITEVPASVPAVLRGDPNRVRQVLTNLVGNAIKFTERGEVVISATLVESIDAEAAVCFRVRDTGIGIAADKLDSVFEQFTQADASMTRRYGGTGLGLTISRQLVTRMGGQLTVTSAPGRGSEFAFTLRLPIETGPSPAPRSHSPVPLSGVRVLVVDDNATNRRILVEVLGAEGMVVVEAPGGAEGLAALRSARPGFTVAIIDAQMPVTDGFALATAVQADPSLAEVRLVMLTSAGQRGDAERCRALGIRGYLNKPIARADLIEAIALVLSPSAPSDVVTRHTITESIVPVRVLLAEDNEVNRQVAVTMLRKRGHSVDVAEDGAQAIAAAAAHTYDVILMDVQMPVLDGLEATRKIRALPGGDGIHIVALTAHALSGDRDRFLAAGMDGYLTKPFKARDLFAMVERGKRGPTQPPVDLSGLRTMLREAGAEGAVAGVIDTFLLTTPDRLAAVQRAVTAGDVTEIGRAAHAFKSAAANIGAGPLAELLARLETSGPLGDPEAVWNELRREYDRVRVQLERERAEGPAAEAADPPR